MEARLCLVASFVPPSDHTFYSAAHGSTANRPGLARFRRVGGDSAGDRRERLACRARVVSIDDHSRLTCCFPRDLKLTGNLVSSREVHLVRRLAPKCRMRKTGVVLLDVERDESPYRADRIERVQVQPLMFEHAPPGLDERVGKRDLRHGQKPIQEAGLDQLIDC